MKYLVRQITPLVQFTNDLVQVLNMYITDLEDIRRRNSIKFIKKHTRIPFSSATISFLQEPYLGMASKLHSLSDRTYLQILACERSSSAFRKGARDFANLRAERQVDARAEKLSVDLQAKLVACVRQLAYSQNYIVSKYLCNDPLAISLMKARTSLPVAQLTSSDGACVI